MNYENEKLLSDRDVLAQELLAEATERFDMDEVLANEEIYRLLFEIQNMTEDNETVESANETVIENDSGEKDFTNLTEKLHSAFSKEFLQKCLISRITIHPDVVHLAIGNGLYLTRDEYEAWKQDNPKINEFKVRAENFTTFQTTGWLRDNFDIEKPIPLPIVIYGFNEGEEDVAHLESIDRHKRLQLYKFGTVTHEIGHHAFQFVLTDEEKKEFATLAKETVPLTEYTKLYQNKEVYNEEQFCEAVRLMTTNPTYLNKLAPKLYTWLENTIPDIKPAPTATLTEI